MNNLRGLAFLFIFLLLISGVVGQVDTSGLEDSLGNVEDNVEDLREFGDKERWEYLGERWKESLLKSKFIQAIDNFFKWIDSYGVFRFLFAEKYDLSLTFFFALVWWVFLFLLFAQVGRDLLWFSKETNVLIAFAFTIILGQLKVIALFSYLTFLLLFYKSGVWGIGWTIAFFVFYFSALFYMKKVVGSLTGMFKGMKEKREKKELERRVEKTEKFQEGLKIGS